MNHSPNSRDTFKNLALLLTHHCVIKSLPDTLSNDERQKITQDVSNKLYTFLCYLFQAKGEERLDFFLSLVYQSPEQLLTLEKPTVDPQIVEAVERVSRGGYIDIQTVIE